MRMLKDGENEDEDERSYNQFNDLLWWILKETN